MLTFKQAFDRLTEAYVNGKVNFMESDSCFCGNLEGHEQWFVAGKHYTHRQYVRMENVFMEPITTYFSQMEPIPQLGNWKYIINDYNRGKIELPGYEDALWTGFNNALAILRLIHMHRGEEINGVGLTKRVGPAILTH